jgi:DHA2 family multidrug resistance protein
MSASAALTKEPRSDSVAIRWIILFAVMLGTILEMLDTSIINVAIPQMMGNLGTTLDQINWVSTSYIIANVIVLPLTGWLSTRFGRRRYLAASMALFTVASLLCGMSRSLNELILFRVLQGAGGAALLSTAQATLLEIFPPKQQGMVAAIFGIGVMMGPTFGPILGGWITDNYNWPMIFYINLPIGVLATILTLIFLYDSPHQEGKTTKIDAVGISLLAIGIGCLQTVLERGNREDWFQSNFICVLSAISAIGLGLFVWWELHIEFPAVNLRVLRHRSLAAATIFAVVLGYGLYSSLFMLPVFLQQVRGYTAEQAGFMLLPDGIAVAVAMGFAGKLVYKTASRNLVAYGALSFMGGMWLLSHITLDTGPSDLAVPLIFRGAGIGLMFVPLALASSAGLKGRDLAEASGLFNLTRQLGGSAGIAFLSTMLDHKMTMHRAYLVEHITPFSGAVVQRINLLEKGLALKGVPAPMVHQKAMAVVDLSVTGQASVMGFSDVFRSLAILFLVALPLLLLLKKEKQDRSTSVTVH